MECYYYRYEKKKKGIIFRISKVANGRRERKKRKESYEREREIESVHRRKKNRTKDKLLRGTSTLVSSLLSLDGARLILFLPEYTCLRNRIRTGVTEAARRVDTLPDDVTSRAGVIYPFAGSDRG